MAGNLVVCDAVMDIALTNLFTLNEFLHANQARLFVNNVTPDPSFDLSFFTEASYPGYAVQDPTPWSGLAQIVPGQYAVTSQVISFPAPTSGGSVTIYGVYVENNTSTLSFSWRFATPVILAPGGTPLIAQIVFDAWAAILLP